MSKLAEKIRRVTRMQPHALGFVTASSAKEPTMVLAGLAKDARAADELARRGADAVIVGTRSSPAGPADAKALGDAVAGAWIAGKGDGEATAYREGGFDFVVFDPDRTAAAAVLDESVGYVLSLPSDLTDVEVRALESFQIDAIHAGKIEGPLTVRRQIDLQRIFALTRKPMMVEVSPAISASELQALRDANVVIVVAEGAQAVEQLRRAIDTLPPRPRRRDERGRTMALVPASSAAPEEEEDDGD